MHEHQHTVPKVSDFKFGFSLKVYIRPQGGQSEEVDGGRLRPAHTATHKATRTVRTRLQYNPTGNLGVYYKREIYLVFLFCVCQNLLDG